MKNLNILIIAYDWPPRNSIACHRPYAWAKFWSEAGAKISVLTAKKCSFDEPLDLNLPNLPGVQVVEVPYWPEIPNKLSIKRGYFSDLINRSKRTAIDSMKRIKNPLLRMFGLNFDIRDRWVTKAINFAQPLVSDGSINCVVSTYGPRGCHLIASEIKNNNPHIKWIADYRDLWSQNHLSEMTARQKIREEKLEKNVLKNADLITTVSLPLASSLSSLLQKKVDVIYNGYDRPIAEVEQNLINKPSLSHGHTIKIVYTGIIYPGRRDPSPLFDAINNLIRLNKIERDKIQVHFYGTRQRTLQKIIRKYSAESYVYVHGHVKRDVALDAQKSADLLLLLESGSEDAKGVLTGKIFEYIASGTPILSLGSGLDSAIADLMNWCGVGVVCGNDSEMIQSTLYKLIAANDIGFYAPDINRIKMFSRSLQSIDFLRKIEALVVK